MMLARAMALRRAVSASSVKVSAAGAGTVARRTMGTDAALYSAESEVEKSAGVSVTFVDYLGHRHTVLGRVGQSLVDVCRTYDMDLLECDTVHGGGNQYEVIHNDVWTEDVFGEGPVSSLSHVIVANEWLAKVPAAVPQELLLLSELDSDQKTSNSRLGSEIYLTKELHGIVVNVPDPPPSDLP
jgi:hypothetical protein